MGETILKKYKIIIDEMINVIEEETSYLQLNEAEKSNMVFSIQEYVIGDVSELVKRDPAALEDVEYVSRAYISIRAVMYYRIAHYFYMYCTTIDKTDTDEDEKESLSIKDDMYKTIARRLSEKAKAYTKIEIHPAATIGTRFVVDHGIGTVIGETCVIGNNCYILQGVVLGASGIGNNQMGKRHPTLMDNVQVGAFARVLGAITIGKDSVINSYCVIVNDLPPNSRVSITNQLQIITSSKEKNVHPSIYGVVPIENKLHIFGEKIALIYKATVIEYLFCLECNSSDLSKMIECNCKSISDTEMIIDVDKTQIKDKMSGSIALMLFYHINNEESYLIITNSRGLSDYVNK